MKGHGMRGRQGVFENVLVNVEKISSSEGDRGIS